MLPFHKRSRQTSELELDTGDLEPVFVPDVRPPAGRPARPNISFVTADDERTMMLPQKRPSSVPPPSSKSLRVPRVPASFMPRMSMSDEVTLIGSGPRSSKSLLTMRAEPSTHQVDSMIRQELASRLEPALPSEPVRLSSSPMFAPAAKAPDASGSGPVQLAMSTDPPAASITTRTQLGIGRPTASWAAALVALGVIGGLLTALLARNAEPRSAAAMVEAPHVQPHAVVAQLPPPAVVQQPIPVAIAEALNPSPPVAACAPPPPPVTVPAPIIVETKPIHIAPTAAPSKPAVVAAAKPVVKAAPKIEAPVAVVQPKAAKPVKASKAAAADDMEQASAADALAKAQLEAALNR